MRRRAASLPTSNPIVLFYAAAPLGVLYVLPMFALRVIWDVGYGFDV
jgi:hypothetical protein